MKTKHLFFDLDRTLWDFDTNSQRALINLFDELKLHDYIADFNDFHNHYKNINAQLWRLYGKGELSKEKLRDERFRLSLKKFNVSDPLIIQKMSDGYVEISPQQTALFPNTIHTLKHLQKEEYNMHIITNGFKEVQHVKLKKSGLDTFFDVTVCSEDVGHNKPSAAIFKYALNRAEAKANDSIMIGDDYEVDIVGAMNCGMKGILFDPQKDYAHSFDIHTINDLSELPNRLFWVINSL